MDSLTTAQLTGSFEASLERFRESLDKGRSKEFAAMEARGAFVARMVEAMEGHEQRAMGRYEAKQGFRTVLQHAFNKAMMKSRMGKGPDEAWAEFWREILPHVEHKLF